MKKENLIFLFVCFGLLVVSCKKFVQISAPPSKVETMAIFKEDATALAAAAGLYAQMANGSGDFSGGGLSLYPALTADELYVPSTAAAYVPFLTNEIQSSNSACGVFWKYAYIYTYYVNSILEGLSHSVSVSQTVKDGLRGQMLFVRGLLYFQLVNVFGDVPLITTTDFELNTNMARTASSKVYAQIISDLSEAKVLLAAGSQTAGNTKPNFWAATALLAKVYLFQKRWSDADEMATEVIKTGRFRLESDLGNVFLINSNETLFQFMRPNDNTPIANYFLPVNTSVIPTFSATDYLLDAFEEGDRRKSSWLKSNTVLGKAYYYPFKYKAKGNGSVREYHIVLRFADLLLIRAEARAQLQQSEAAKADLNMVRNRAELGNIESDSGEDLLDAILKERQLELFTEWGNRWFDLKRTGKADQILGARKGATWQSTDALFPIPSGEIKNNPALIQNPGYE